MSASFDVTQIEALAERLSVPMPTDQQVAEFVAEMGDAIHDRMRDEVPVDSGETRDSITVVYSDGGRSVSVGPTNVDGAGRPVAHFIVHGARGIPPNPFDMRTAEWARQEVAERGRRWLDSVL